MDKQQDRERTNLDAQFPVSPTNNKIVKERNWTGLVTSKINESAFDKKDVLCEMRTPWKLLRRDEVSGGDQSCAANYSDSPRAMRSTDDPDDDSQQGPDFVDARLRAESSSDGSAVARLCVADLEPACLREREREQLHG